MRFDGNSSAASTTLSPACQGKPKATTEIASEVFLSSATSLASPPIRRARRSRSRRSTCNQRG
jgi:hypothetical protein